MNHCPLSSLVPGMVVALAVPHDGEGEARFPSGRVWFDLAYDVVDATVIRITELEAETADGPIQLMPTDPERPECTHRLTIQAVGKQWTGDFAGRLRVAAIPPHHQRCGECGQLWPCRDERMDREARRFARELDDICDHCGKPIGSAWKATVGGTPPRRFHIAKKYRATDRTRCVDAYEAIHGQEQTR